MMSLNRYRLRHLARKKHRVASRVFKLLERTDRLLGVILIGNTFANIFASSIMTVIAVHYFGDLGIALAAVFLTLVILIFAEMAPKTLAALNPQKIAFPISLPLEILLKVLYPLVWLANGVVNGLLRLFGIKMQGRVLEQLSREELRTVVHEAAGKISSGRQGMLLSILDLEEVAVNDIMVPNGDIVGIDLNASWDAILALLNASQHTRLPVYKGSIDHVQGILHLRHALNLMASNRLNKSTLVSAAEEVYYVPEGTPLSVQLLNFQQAKCRVGLVVDEYGDIQGLVTLEDILEEIVGEFTTDFAALGQTYQRQKDGCYLVDGGVNVRELNRNLLLQLPTDGPKTLSGMIIEHLQMIPHSRVSMRIAGYPIEVTEIEAKMVKTLRIWPKLRQQETQQYSPDNSD